MNRSTKVAILVAGAVATCVIAACGVALALRDWVPGLAGCEDSGRPTKTGVFTETVRIEQLYPELKPIRSVHWQEHEVRARSCPEIGPMDYEMNGFAVITPERAAALAAAPASAAPASAAPASAAPASAAPDVPEPSDIPVDLQQFAPPAPRWQAVGPGLLLDQPSATVYFTHRTS